MSDSEDSVDVAVVGGRVAGSTLAARLAGAGLRVAVFERAEVLDRTLSTHILHSTEQLRVEGVYDELIAAGVPALSGVDVRVDDVHLRFRHTDDPGLCPPRELLDTVLLDRARKAGARVHLGSPVSGLLRDQDGRVTGVAVGDRRVGARLVVGADGRSSSVARWAGAREYLRFRSGRGQFWQYFEGKRLPRELFWHRRGARVAHIVPTGPDTYYLCAQPPVGDTADFRGRDGDALLPWVRTVSAEIADLAEGGVPVSRMFRMIGYPCFFRTSHGPGWVLVGDAGHAKDATIGHGINDALLNTRDLAGRLLATWDDPAGLDRTLAGWVAERDRREMSNFFYSQDLGDGRQVGRTFLGLLRDIGRTRRDVDRLDAVMGDKLAADQVFTLPRLVRVASTMLRSGQRPGDVWRDTTALAGLAVSRRLAVRRLAADAPEVPELDVP